MSDVETPQIEAPPMAEPTVLDAPDINKDAWISGPADLIDEVVELNDGRSVRIRGLTAGQRAQMMKDCTVTNGQKFDLDYVAMKVHTFCMGVVEPKFSYDEANMLAFKFGPDFDYVVEAINAISAVHTDDIERAKRRFQKRR